MATAPSPNDLTRQQLDELDALLQRMLSVPLAPADTPLPAALNRAEAPPLPPSWRIDPPAPAPTASVPHLLLAEPHEEEAEPEPAKPQPAPPPKPQAATPPKPQAVPEPTKPQPAPALKPKVTAPEPVKPQAAAPVPPAPQAVAPPGPPVPLPLLPLVALNTAFDTACGLLGPPGRLLRSGFFKHVYGLIGLGLLAYTAAHVAQVQAWISLPVVLPWPR